MEKDLIETNRQFVLAQQFGKIGHFDWDIVENEIKWSREMYRIFDIKTMAHNPTLYNILSRVHEDDKTRVEKEIEHSFDSGTYNLEYRLKMDNGQVKHVQAHGKVEYGDTDTPTRMIGTVQDITELVQAQQEADFFNHRMEALMNSSLIGVYLYDVVKGNNSYINDTYTRITGYTLEQLNQFGEDEFMQLFHPEDQEKIADHMENVSQSRDGEVFQIQYRFLHVKGHWIRLQSCDAVFRFDPAGKAIEFMGSIVEVADSGDS